MEERKIYAHELDDDENAMEAQNVIATDEGMDQQDEQQQEPIEQIEEEEKLLIEGGHVKHVEQDDNGENSNSRDIENLNDMLQEDPHNATLYQQIIEHYKRLGRSEMVQKTRSQAIEQTTLSLDMWKDWIEDAKLEASTFQERVKIGEIFEMALDSFNYFDLSKGYAEHILGLHSDPENDGSIGQAEVKKVFDKVLRVWLLDFSHSTEIWQMYLQFELDAYSAAAEASNEEVKASKERSIRALYRQKLCFPTIDLDLVWEEYQTWEKEQSKIGEMKQKYEKASEKVPNMIKFEDNLTSITKEAEFTNSKSILVSFNSFFLSFSFSSRPINILSSY